MDTIQRFLVVMAALSAGAQTLTEHLVKKRFALELDQTKSDPVAEARRQSIIHLCSAVFGALLAATAGLRPLSELANPGGTPDAGPSLLRFPAVEYVLVGVLVSYGGSLFNEILGALQQFKDAQAQLKSALGLAAISPVAPGAQAVVSAAGAPQVAGASSQSITPDAGDYFDASNAG